MSLNVTVFFEFAVLGLGAGGAYALLATGVVAIYRASRVLNLAQGAFAMAGGYIYYTFQQLHGWASLPAARVRPDHERNRRSVERDRHASTARLVGGDGRDRDGGRTLGDGGQRSVDLGGRELSVNSLLPTHVTHFGGLVVGVDRLLIVAIAALLSFGLWAGSRFTKLGVAVSAVAENPRAAATLDGPLS